MKKIILLSFISVLLLLPASVQGQGASVPKAEYLFPISYGADAAQNDVIGLRVYQNLDNKDPLSWYLDNVSNPKNSLPEIKADGYVAVRDDRTIYIQAANIVLTSPLDPQTASPTPRTVSSFWTNIYVLAYNQNASPETVNIFNQMLTNLKFNKNVMGIYCLKSQFEAVKESLRRDTIRKSDIYKLTTTFKKSPGLNLQAGTYVPGMSISTWPSWQATLGKQLGTALPVDPFNIMADRLIACTANEQCATGQCSAGYCSACPIGYDARTCWDEKKLKYFAIDGFVYKYQNGVLTIRFEYPQIEFPATDGECFMGCSKDGQYYNLGSCQSNNQYCTISTTNNGWATSECGDNMVRCNEVCDCDKLNLASCNCAISYDSVTQKYIGCLSCKKNYHAVGSLCKPDTRDLVTAAFTQTLSTAEEQRWTGEEGGWSDPYATSCVANAVLDNLGVCHCQTNYNLSGKTCVPATRTFTCELKPTDVGIVWNTVSSYLQTWDGQKWMPVEKITEYNETPATDACHYKCAVGYHYVNGTCVSNTGQNCSLPAAATTLNIWDNTLPVPAFVCKAVTCVAHATLNNTTKTCACDTHYILDGNICQADTMTYNCPTDDKPANTVWNPSDKIIQTWNPATLLWEPGDHIYTAGEVPSVYNAEIAPNNECRYKCADTYARRGNTCIKCGNGITDTSAGEECDDGNVDDNPNNNTICDDNCKWIIKTDVAVFGSTLQVSKSSNGINFDNESGTGNSEEKGSSFLKVAPVSQTPYIWVANTNLDKISKIRAFDGPKMTKAGPVYGTFEKRGQLIGIYPRNDDPKTTELHDPSRTAVNVETGEVWVVNRNKNRYIPSGDTVVKMDIDGNVLKECSTDNNTSRSAIPRGIVIEQNGDVWVANSNQDTVVKFSGDDSDCGIKATVTVGSVPYGLAIDSDNNIWVVNQGSDTIGKIDTSRTPITMSETHSSVGYPYGIAIDKDDNVWVGNYTFHGLWKISNGATAGSAAVKINLGTNGTTALSYTTTGVAIDKDNNIWASDHNGGGVVQVNRANPLVSSFHSVAPGSYPHGIAGDSVGQIWSIARGTTSGDGSTHLSRLTVFDGSSGALLQDNIGTPLAPVYVNAVYCIIGTENEVNRPDNQEKCANVQPYTYSDMTGLNRAMVLRSGVYQEIKNGGNQDQHWGYIDWDEIMDYPGPQSVEVSVRASNILSNDGTLPDPNTIAYNTSASWNSTPSLRVGQYVEIKVVIRSSVKDNTPVVYNLAIVPSITNP